MAVNEEPFKPSLLGINATLNVIFVFRNLLVIGDMISPRSRICGPSISRDFPRKIFLLQPASQNPPFGQPKISITKPSMAKISKQFKKFAASGKLKDQIKSRRQHQQIKRKTEDRNARRQKQRGAPREDGGVADKDGEEEVDGAREVKRAGGRAGGVAKTVDELFGAGGMEHGFEDGSELEELSDDDEENTGGTEESEENGEEGEGEELDEVAMKKAMKDLEKKDPEFFKYLKENDRDLLSFGNEGKGKGKREAEVEDDEDEEMDPAEDDEDEDEVEIERRKTSVTMKMLRQWQEGMLKVSLSSGEQAYPASKL